MHFPVTGEPRGHLLTCVFGALLMGDFVWDTRRLTPAGGSLDAYEPTFLPNQRI